MVQNGGRNGISLTAGMRWAICKDKKPVEKVHLDNNKLKVENGKLKDRKAGLSAQNNKKQIKTANKNNEVKVTNKTKITSCQRIRNFIAKMDGEPIANN